jgi:hypothetical protein
MEVVFLEAKLIGKVGRVVQRAISCSQRLAFSVLVVVNDSSYSAYASTEIEAILKGGFPIL